jgi:Zn-dependent protease with chaperone function
MTSALPGDLRRSFVKVLLLPALTFLFIPLVAIGFTRYGEAKIDGMILHSIEEAIDRDGSRSEPEQASAKAFFAAHPASAACADPDPRLDRFREAVCKRWSDVWQFRTAERLGWFAAWLGLAAFLMIGALGLVAFWDRRAQYWSFMLGWRGLVAVTVIETVAQGVLAVWLSYWITALLFERYVPKLILVAGIAAALAVVAIVRALLRRVPDPEPLEANRVTESEAPGLWRRVKDLAARLGTVPPATIAAGIDDNFFVTEHAMPLTDGTPGGGRLLYVSLPLLRALSPAEADAVFGHELAHFQGGDTAASARLYPMLARYQAYWSALATGGLTLPASYVMRLYRAIFELALKREQRRRELLADAEAARLTSPEDLGRSLLKIIGYSSFRSNTEQALFDHRAVHEGGLALRERIEAGLAAHAASAGFQEHVRTLRVPHPFDSHPPLEERLANVAASVRAEDAARLLQERPARTWADDVLTAGAIEERLWGAYEARFKASHEASLAWRYLPATDAERDLVRRFFPDVCFPTKDGGLTLTYLALTRPDGETIPLADIEAAKINNGTFSNQLVLTRRRGDGKSSTFKVNLKTLGKQAEAFKRAFSKYWQRNQTARRGR